MKCNHPVFLQIDSETDSYEGRTYLTGVCILCNKKKEDRDKRFKRIIHAGKKMKKDTLYEVKQRYLELNNAEVPDEMILTILKQEY